MFNKPVTSKSTKPKPAPKGRPLFRRETAEAREARIAAETAVARKSYVLDQKRRRSLIGTSGDALGAQ